MRVGDELPFRSRAAGAERPDVQEVWMSELLVNGLVSTKRELEAGLADAERELAQHEEYCRKLEELIAVGKATLHAASQTTFQSSAPVREMPSARPVATPSPTGQAGDSDKRLAKEAQN